MCKLKYDELEQGWVCCECGAIYGTEEIRRLFNYDNEEDEVLRKRKPNELSPIFCMDCGMLITEVE